MQNSRVASLERGLRNLVRTLEEYKELKICVNVEIKKKGKMD